MRCAFRGKNAKRRGRERLSVFPLMSTDLTNTVNSSTFSPPLTSVVSPFFFHSNTAALVTAVYIPPLTSHPKAHLPQPLPLPPFPPPTSSLSRHQSSAPFPTTSSSHTSISSNDYNRLTARGRMYTVRLAQGRRLSRS